MLGAYLFQPLRSPPAGGDDGGVRVDLAALALAVGDIYAAADIVFEDDVAAFRAEKHLDAAVAETVLYGEIYALRLLGAHVADGTIHQLEPRADSLFSDLLDFLFVADAFDVLVRAEFEIDLVRVVDEILRLVPAYELGKLAAHLRRKRKFAVRKRARTRKSRGDVAVRTAVAAGTALRLGAPAPFDGQTLFDEDDAPLVTLPEQFERGEYPGGTRTHYGDVVFFHFSPRPPPFRRRDLVHYITASPLCQRLISRGGAKCYFLISLTLTVPAVNRGGDGQPGRGRRRPPPLTGRTPLPQASPLSSRGRAFQCGRHTNAICRTSPPPRAG